jgi:endothelin-converting enzyme/putative endopeptidase
MRLATIGGFLLNIIDRHCERSEAINRAAASWIASSAMLPRNDGIPKKCRSSVSKCIFLLVVLAFFLFAPPSRAAEPPGIDDSMIDPTVAPCDDFYRYACGGWLARHPVPPDEASWDVDDLVTERTLGELKAILEEAAAAPTDATRKIGDFYAACVDEARVTALGVAPARPTLDRIAGLSRDALPALVAALHLGGIGAFFDTSVGQDARNAKRNIVLLDEGGMGLPGRDYYLKQDGETIALRGAYQAHIAEVLRLAGDDAAAAASEATSVLTVETALAQGAFDRLQKRDPLQTYHRLDRAAWGRLAPGFDWRGYFAALGTALPVSVDVTEPSYLAAAATVMRSADLADLKAYLRWQLLNAVTPSLPQPFIDANFAFYGKRLTGAARLRPRWKRCIGAVNAALGEDLGRVWVARFFPPGAKARTEAMIGDIEHAFAAEIRRLRWMGPATRRRALAKLRAMRHKVGYPDHWRDYGGLEVSRDDAYGNARRAAAFELRRQLAKLGHKVDRGEWDMTPPTVDAYYDPQLNDIDFPAGVFQPPLFSPAYDDAVNYGATGATVGHEMTHGFDDEGRQFDGDGDLRDWWTPRDAGRFTARAQCLVEQYGGYRTVDGVPVDGQLTLGENLADLGGARLAYDALKRRLARPAKTPAAGRTPAQRFFLAYAQSWCAAVRPETARLRAQTDPHAPPRFRVDGVLADMPEFRAAFACPARSPMVRAPICRVW